MILITVTGNAGKKQGSETSWYRLIDGAINFFVCTKKDIYHHYWARAGMGKKNQHQDSWRIRKYHSEY